MTIDDFRQAGPAHCQGCSKAESRWKGADKLLAPQVLDVGGVERNVLAGIAKAYRARSNWWGVMVVFFANLKPRKMRFGLSEGMCLAAGSGGKNVYLLKPDEGAQPGDVVS